MEEKKAMSDTVEIRLATKVEIPALVGFNVEMAMETEGRKLPAEVIEAGVAGIFERPGRGFYLVATFGEEVVGSLMVTMEWSDWRNGDFWWVQSVYVLPERRGCGVFRALYERVREMAAGSEEVCGCRLYVEKENRAAQAVYRRLGLEETPYRLFEDSFD